MWSCSQFQNMLRYNITAHFFPLPLVAFAHFKFIVTVLNTQCNNALKYAMVCCSSSKRVHLLRYTCPTYPLSPVESSLWLELSLARHSVADVERALHQSVRTVSFAMPDLVQRYYVYQFPACTLCSPNAADMITLCSAERYDKVAWPGRHRRRTVDCVGINLAFLYKRAVISL